MVLSGLQTQVAGALAVKTPSFTNCDFGPPCRASELQPNRKHFSKTIQHVLHRVLLTIRQFTTSNTASLARI